MELLFSRTLISDLYYWMKGISHFLLDSVYPFSPTTFPKLTIEVWFLSLPSFSSITPVLPPWYWFCPQAHWTKFSDLNLAPPCPYSPLSLLCLLSLPSLSLPSLSLPSLLVSLLVSLCPCGWGWGYFRNDGGEFIEGIVS